MSITGPIPLPRQHAEEAPQGEGDGEAQHDPAEGEEEGPPEVGLLDQGQKPFQHLERGHQQQRQIQKDSSRLP